MQRAQDIFERQTRCAWTRTLSPETRRALLQAMQDGPRPRRCFSAALEAAALVATLVGLGVVTAAILIL
jgi:hypothetical protein